MRDSSNIDAEFVGHRREVTCARFLPRILLINGRRRCLLAIGSKDRALSLWLTSPRQPLCIVNDFFAAGILDLSWYLNDETGLITLGICSPDGACAFITFAKGEIGTALTRQEMAKFYTDLYKVDITIPTKTITNGLVTIGVSPSRRLYLFILGIHRSLMEMVIVIQHKQSLPLKRH